MMKIRNVLYYLLVIAFSIIIGAAVFEHLVIWPDAYAAPPMSLSMFQGEYGVDAGLFWRKIHPVVLLLFIICTVITWKTERRLHILIPFIGYVLVMITTMMYFVPELIEIINTPFSDQVDQDLVSRGSMWINLSLVRLVIIIGLVMYMLQGLTKREMNTSN